MFFKFSKTDVYLLFSTAYKIFFLFTSKLITEYKIYSPILIDYKVIPEPISIKDIWDDIMKVVSVIIEAKNKYDEITKTTQE